jgi:hypothetical protein
LSIIKKNKIHIRNNPRTRRLEEVIEDLKEDNSTLRNIIEKKNKDITQTQKIFQVYSFNEDSLIRKKKDNI